MLHKFDITCLFETCLDSITLSGDDNLEMLSYSLICTDHLSNKKCGGVCSYFKYFLSLRVCDMQLLDKFIKFELKVGDNKPCRSVALYRSPRQTEDGFLPFSQNFELTLKKLSENNLHWLAAIDVFNAIVRHWHSQHTNIFEEISVENIASQFGLHEIIKKPTHLWKFVLMYWLT